MSKLVSFIPAINCTADPVGVENTTKGSFDWDGENKTFTAIVRYYCPKNGWGYPSNGYSEMLSHCQADKTWSLTSIEDCVCKNLSTTKAERNAAIA